MASLLPSRVAWPCRRPSAEIGCWTATSAGWLATRADPLASAFPLQRPRAAADRAPRCVPRSAAPLTPRSSGFQVAARAAGDTPAGAAVHCRPRGIPSGSGHRQAPSMTPSNTAQASAKALAAVAGPGSVCSLRERLVGFFIHGFPRTRGEFAAAQPQAVPVDLDEPSRSSLAVTTKGTGQISDSGRAGSRHRRGKSGGNVANSGLIQAESVPSRPLSAPMGLALKPFD